MDHKKLKFEKHLIGRHPMLKSWLLRKRDEERGRAIKTSKTIGAKAWRMYRLLRRKILNILNTQKNLYKK